MPNELQLDVVCTRKHQIRIPGHVFQGRIPMYGRSPPLNVT